MKWLILACLFTACASPSEKRLKEEYARLEDSIKVNKQIVQSETSMLPTLKTEEAKKIFNRYLDSLVLNQKRLEKRKQELAEKLFK